MMPFRSARLAAGLVLALAMAPMPLAAFDDTERAGMIAAVEDFSAAFGAGDYETVFGYMPPKVLTTIAASAGISEVGLLEALAAQIDEAMSIVTVESYLMDTGSASYATTPDGSRDYALIPTETVMEIEGVGRMRATSETLAFFDEGAWYLVRIDEVQQVEILRQAYPEFAGVDFPPGTLEPLE